MCSVCCVAITEEEENDKQDMKVFSSVVSVAGITLSVMDVFKQVNSRYFFILLFFFSCHTHIVYKWSDKRHVEHYVLKLKTKYLILTL